MSTHPAPTLLLDVDDTMVATFATGVTKFRMIADRLQIARPGATDLLAAGYGTATFSECVGRLFPRHEVSVVSSMYDELCDVVPTQTLGDSHALVMVARQSGWRVGVLTNGRAGKTKHKLAVCGLSDTDFDIVVNGDSAPVAKPHPEAFRHVCEAAGLDPASTWYVSDSPSDWMGAELAGLLSVGVSRGRPTGSVGFPGPRLAIADVTALSSLIPALKDVQRSTDLGEARAVSCDVGDTLCVPVRNPGELLSAEVPADVDARLAAAVGLLPPEAWCDDARNLAALTLLWSQAATNSHAAEAALRVFIAASNWRELDPGRTSTLREFAAAGIPVGLLSNWQSSLRHVVNHALAGSSFSTVLSSCAIGLAKPDPRAFEMAANALGVAVTSLVHVGDSAQTDVAGSLSAGARCVYVSRCDDLTSLLGLALGGRPMRSGQETVLG